MTSPARAPSAVNEGQIPSDPMSYLERVARAYLKRLVWPTAVICGLIVFDLWREGAAVYKVPVDRTHELLESAGLPDYVFGLGTPKQFDMDARDPRKIVWIVKDGGREAMRFAALLSPVDADSTKVGVEISGPTSGAFGDMQRRLSENRAIRHLYVMAMKERIAATLEGREFSMLGLIPATVFATLTTVVKMALSHDPKAAETEEAARMDRERQSIERAYRR